MTMNEISVVAVSGLLLTLAACTFDPGSIGKSGSGSSVEGSSDPTTTTTTSTCEGYQVKEGDYRCEDGRIGAHAIEVCKNGKWEPADTCSCSVSVGDPRKPPYPTSCTLGSSKGNTLCSYAGKACSFCRAGEACESL